ncbi:helix-turn-helix transcriptional regulator [Chloroflexi bacterium TSY]|nr:helix-turn-helix transcriptional regulator [Chloroflexi bacterium TSY]
MNTHHFNDITEASRFLGWPAPEHPLLNVFSIEASANDGEQVCFDEPTTISNDFYTIALKNVTAGEMLYGRTKYDFKNGTMIFTGPRQQIVLDGVAVAAKSRHLCIHEDFIKGHDIRDRIKQYGFFSYAVNEALHLSPKEEQLIGSTLDNIETEYHNNPDEYSKEIILSQIDTLLKYANRFYRWQFLHRQETSGAILFQFERAIAAHFETGQLEIQGTPRVEEIAQSLDMSPRYLSDSLKTETGKTAIEHIHLHLVDEAKNLLLEPTLTVSETAYKLGFDNPQYFARLFKKKVGTTPSAYREQYLLNR